MAGIPTLDLALTMPLVFYLAWLMFAYLTVKNKTIMERENVEKVLLGSLAKVKTDLKMSLTIRLTVLNSPLRADRSFSYRIRVRPISNELRMMARTLKRLLGTEW